MKHLSPQITCLMTVHKNPLLESALRSVVDQTRSDVQVLVVDSGSWKEFATENDKKHADLYMNYSRHPMIEWIFTGESKDASKSTCMVAKVFNDVFRQDLVKGKYFCTFYEDDLYNPQFFEKMAGFLDTHPDYDAVRCSQEWVKVNDKGVVKPVVVRKADKDLLPTDQFNNVVDGGQVMVRTRSIYSMVSNQYPRYDLIPESPDTCRHSDGLFFEKLKIAITKMGYIDEVLYTHRFSPDSTFTKNTQI